MKYTDEQKKDIGERVTKAAEMLKELQLIPSAQVTKINTGDDCFVDKVVCYLQDVKFTTREDVFPPKN